MLGWTERNWLYNLYWRCPCNFSRRKSQKWNTSVGGRGGILLCHCPISYPPSLSFPVQPILWRWEIHLGWMQMHLYRQFHQQHLMAGRMQRWWSTWILDWCRSSSLIFSWFNEEVFALISLTRTTEHQTSSVKNTLARNDCLYLTWLCGASWSVATTAPMTVLIAAFSCTSKR